VYISEHIYIFLCVCNLSSLKATGYDEVSYEGFSRHLQYVVSNICKVVNLTSYQNVINFSTITHVISFILYLFSAYQFAIFFGPTVLIYSAESHTYNVNESNTFSFLHHVQRKIP
jgi:hypothetical protein